MYRRFWDFRAKEINVLVYPSHTHTHTQVPFLAAGVPRLNLEFWNLVRNCSAFLLNAQERLQLLGILKEKNKSEGGVGRRLSPNCLFRFVDLAQPQCYFLQVVAFRANQRTEAKVNVYFFFQYKKLE